MYIYVPKFLTQFMSWKFKLLSFVELSYIANSCVNRDANFFKMSRESLFVFYVCSCLRTMCKQCQKRESDALELKSQVVVSLHVGAWNRMSPSTPGPLEE